VGLEGANINYRFPIITKNATVSFDKQGFVLEFVTGGVELLKAVLHGYAGGLIFMK